MSQMLSLPDELYQQLASYAAQHHRTPEEVLAALVQGLSGGPNLPDDVRAAAAGGPWEGFYGAFEVTPPDAIERHDEIIGHEALGSHDVVE
ncbi:MAG TPA: hypothetical protein VF116_12775 [Ktedonobacterales bacterium]